MDDRLAPGFPKHILQRDGTVVDADPMLVHAAAFLDTMPLSERVSPEELGAEVGVDVDRAQRGSSSSSTRSGTLATWGLMASDPSSTRMARRLRPR